MPCETERTNSAQSPTVLVVDDDELYRDALVELIGLEGYAATGAADAVGALRYVAAADRAPTLVLVDVTLSGVGGWDLLRRLRADPRLATTTFAMMSASPALLRAVPEGAGSVHLIAKSIGVRPFLALARRLAPSAQHDGPEGFLTLESE